MTRVLPAALACLLALPGVAGAVADPVVLGTAVATVNLPTAVGGAAMSIGYDPVLGLYYSGMGGNPSQPGFVWNLAGTRLQTLTPINVDIRGVNYNPTTGNIEIESFDAKNGGVQRGIITMGRTSAGLWTGGVATALAAAPGLTENQTMPAYDPARNRLYSRSNLVSVNSIHVTNRSSGALITTVTIDTAGLGPGSFANYTLGFDSSYDVFIVLDNARRRAFVYRLNGTRVGICNIPGTFALDSNYGLGYANGQLFLFDSASNQYQGFRIFQLATVSVALGSRQYALATWPVTASDTTVAGTIVTQIGPADTLVWRLGHFLPAKTAYSLAGTFYAGIGRQLTGIHAEEGYWFIASTARTINVLGQPLPNGYDIPLLSGPGGAAAWNQFGSSFLGPTPVAAMLVRQGATILSLTNPMQTLTDQVVWTWNGSAYVQQGGSGSVPAGQGFWVKRQSAAAVNIVLFRDITIPGPALASKPAVEEASPGFWDVKLVARQGTLESNLLNLGAADVDASRWNPLAHALPPGPPGSYLRLVVPKTDWGDQNDEYASDFQPPAETMSWEFVLTGGESPGEIELSLTGGAAASGVRFALTDLDRGMTWDVSPGATLSLAATATEHRLRLTATSSAVGPRADIGVRFRAYPNPFGTSTGIVAQLPSAGDVRVGIFDVAGRLVRGLERAKATSGEIVIVWDGRDDAGHGVDPGLYFARCSAGNATGVVRIVRAR